jgi:hypothetical protein
VTPEGALSVEPASCASPARATSTRCLARYTTGQFESWTRFELLDPNYKKP